MSGEHNKYLRSKVELVKGVYLQGLHIHTHYTTIEFIHVWRIL